MLYLEGYFTPARPNDQLAKLLRDVCPYTAGTAISVGAKSAASAEAGWGRISCASDTRLPLSELNTCVHLTVEGKGIYNGTAHRQK